MLKIFSIGTPVYDRNTNGKENLSDQLIERMEENVIKIESEIHNGKIGKCQMYNVTLICGTSKIQPPAHHRMS